MTYAERMAAFEREQDERQWSDLYYKVTHEPEYSHLIEEVVLEGVELGYDIPLADIEDRQLMYAVKCAIISATQNRK